MTTLLTRLVTFFALACATLAVAMIQAQADTPPPCPSYDHDLPVNNAQVLHWKRTTANQFRERGHVHGRVLEVYQSTKDHAHFSVQLGKRADETLEVIYNQEFGRLPEVKAGMDTEACGDYITSTAQSGPYPPSPDGAIIHWVHMNPSGRGHPPGFLVLNGAIYGQDAEHAGPRRPRLPMYLDLPAYLGN